MRAGFDSRPELAFVAAALLLPIPLVAASDLVVPLPSAVERALVSLLPGGEVESRPRGGRPVSASPRSSGEAAGRDSSGSKQRSAGVLSEGGNAAAPAGDGATGSDDSAADYVLPGDERLLPGGGRSDPPVAPHTPGGPAGPETGEGGTTPAPAPAAGAEPRDIPAVVPVVPEVIEVDTSVVTAGVAGVVGATVGVSPPGGVTLTVDADPDATSDDLTVTVPVSLPPLPTLPRS